ncbi:MAG: hypothetical protein ACK40M_12820 [Flavobacteriales bacterium]
MKTFKVFFLLLFIGTSLSSGAQITKTVAPSLAFKYFKDTLVVDHNMEVTVTNAANLTVTMAAQSCTVTRTDGGKTFIVKAPRALNGQRVDIVVTKTTSSGTVEIIRRSVLVVAATPELISRMQN